jgi:hypothetical protein
MTSAEIMRQQMRVTEQSDARLRRTLMRAVVGQVGIHAYIYARTISSHTDAR